jgi:sigma-B regulation protein RsbU (phosphoserine phosphatase)
MPNGGEAGGFSELVVGEACLIQKLLLPREPLRAPGFEISYFARSHGEVSGDFLDYFCLTDGRLGIYMGDVVGKGLPAAMYAALAMGTLRSIHKAGERPADVLELFNKRLLVRPVPSRYCATQYAVFDPVNMELHLANAGLPYPIHLSATGCRTLGSSGLPSGLFEAAQYDQATFRLAPGDAVLFATDGLSEARDGHGRQIDMSQLVQLCTVVDYSTADILLQNVFEGIEQFAQGSQSDDMTAVALKIWPRNEGVAV